MQPNPEKTKIRDEILQKRLALNDEEVHFLSLQIQQRLLKSSLWKNCERLGLYSATKNEVETYLLFMKALDAGISLYFPRVEQGIKFYEVNEPSDLEKGAWSILEPKHSCNPLLPSQKFDLLVIPGVAFDKRGFRIGFGRGFYDRVLEEFHDVSVALAYEFQIKDELPIDKWDKKVVRLVTEKNEYIIS